MGEIQRLKDEIDTLEIDCETLGNDIDSLKADLAVKDEQIFVLERIVDTQKGTIQVLSDAIVEKSLLVKVHRDGLTRSEAITVYANEFGRPISEIEKVAAIIEW